MAFWGIEVKPGKPFTHTFDPVRGRLRISQATLGIGSAMKTSLVQCNVGDKRPVLLCALLPDKTESCHLDLEFQETDEVVFSVLGPRSVHLTGFYLVNRTSNGRSSNLLDDDSESYGVDIANTDDESVQRDDDEYGGSFINDDDDLELYSASPVSSDRVTDEENVDKKKQKVKRDTRKRLKKKYQAIESDDEINSHEKVVVNVVSGSESEDDDEFPIFSTRKSKEARGEKSHKNVSTTVDCTESKSNDQAVNTSGEPERKSKRKRKNRTDGNITAQAGDFNPSSVMDDDKCLEVKAKDPLPAGDKEIGLSPEAGGEKRKKRSDPIAEKKFEEGSKKNDNVLQEDSMKKNEEGTGADGQDVNIAEEDFTLIIDNNIDSKQVADRSQLEEKKTKKKKMRKMLDYEGNEDVGSPLSGIGLKHKVESSKSKSLSDGLIIEELEEGKMDGKIAAPGKKVKVYYTGWLKDNKQVFDTNVGEAPLKFRLGGKDVTEAWNVGLDGMRVGGKRKLTVPPSMRFGDQGAGKNMPPDSWLEYEIELVSVR